MSLPDKIARSQIMDLNLKGKPVDESIDTMDLAAEIIGFTGEKLTQFPLDFP